MSTVPAARPDPDPRDVKRWRRYLADEQAEAAVYRDLASRRSGEEREILLALADAEGRHEAHWRALLGDHVGKPLRGDIRTRILGFLARRFGSVFVLALAQRAETRSPYPNDADATASMGADEKIHEEVVRALATRGRNRLSGTFRAAVFGANDGLVSNLALVLGISGSGVSNQIVLITGMAGLLAGALSMGAGEYVSVRSQRELLEASNPGPAASEAVGLLDVRRERIVPGLPGPRYVRRGSDQRAAEVLANSTFGAADVVDDHETVGNRVGRSGGKFLLLRLGRNHSGAAVPVRPGRHDGSDRRICSRGDRVADDGVVVGLLSGGPPFKRALRQLAIGYGAAGATYLLGMLFGTSL